MFALMQLRKEDRYSVSLRQFIEERTGIRYGLTTIWDALETLDRWGYIDSDFGEPTRKRGGRRKRIFRLNGVGEAALRDAQRAEHAMGLSALRNLGATEV